MRCGAALAVAVVCGVRQARRSMTPRVRQVQSRWQAQLGPHDGRFLKTRDATYARWGFSGFEQGSAPRAGGGTGMMAGGVEYGGRQSTRAVLQLGKLRACRLGVLRGPGRASDLW